MAVKEQVLADILTDLPIIAPDPSYVDQNFEAQQNLYVDGSSTD